MKKEEKLLRLIESTKYQEQQLADKIIKYHRKHPVLYDATFSDEKYTIFHLLVIKNKLIVLEHLLKKESFHSIALLTDKDKQTILHYAVKGGDSAILTLLLAKFPEVKKAVDNVGNSLLHQAVIAQNIEAIKKLVNDPDIDTNLKNNQGKTPFDLTELAENKINLQLALLTVELSKLVETTNESLTARKKLFEQFPTLVRKSTSSFTFLTSPRQVAKKLSPESNTTKSKFSQLFEDNNPNSIVSNSQYDDFDFKEKLISEPFKELIVTITNAKSFLMRNLTQLQPDLEQEYKIFDDTKKQLQKELLGFLIIGGLRGEAPSRELPTHLKKENKAPLNNLQDTAPLCELSAHLNEENKALLNDLASEISKDPNSVPINEENRDELEREKQEQKKKEQEKKERERKNEKNIWLIVTCQLTPDSNRLFNLEQLIDRTLGLQQSLSTKKILAYLEKLYPLFDKQQKLAASCMVCQLLIYCPTNHYSDKLKKALLSFAEKSGAIETVGSQLKQRLNSLITATDELHKLFLSKNYHLLCSLLNHDKLSEGKQSFDKVVNLALEGDLNAIETIAHDLRMRTIQFYQTVAIEEIHNKITLGNSEQGNTLFPTLIREVYYLDQLNNYLINKIINLPSDKITTALKVMVQLFQALCSLDNELYLDLNHGILITGVLSHNSITRLTPYIDQLPQKTIQTKTEIEKLVTPLENFVKVRTVLKNCNALPPLSLVMKDFTFANEYSNPLSRLESAGSKRKELELLKAKLRSEIILYHTDLAEFLTNYQAIGEEDLYLLSNQLRPKEIVLINTIDNLDKILITINNIFEEKLSPIIYFRKKTYPESQLANLLFTSIFEELDNEHSEKALLHLQQSLEKLKSVIRHLTKKYYFSKADDSLYPSHNVNPAQLNAELARLSKYIEGLIKQKQIKSSIDNIFKKLEKELSEEILLHLQQYYLSNLKESIDQFAEDYFSKANDSSYLSRNFNPALLYAELALLSKHLEKLIKQKQIKSLTEPEPPTESNSLPGNEASNSNSAKRKSLPTEFLHHNKRLTTSLSMQQLNKFAKDELVLSASEPKLKPAPKVSDEPKKSKKNPLATLGRKTGRFFGSLGSLISPSSTSESSTNNAPGTQTTKPTNSW